ncbi:MAG: hypothetical protein B6I20_12140 [Bacteroidetes bacterium 4572_117]|nr:MAG: hypothetical protein B6I20_12140 [Bacteroidetes bacterium 4572_117]
MVWNYIVVAFRNMFRQVCLNLISITGVSVGFAVAILLFLYVANELSYNKQHTNYNKIYRFVSEVDFGGKEKFVAANSLGTTGPHIDTCFNGLVTSCRFFVEDFSNKSDKNSFSENIHAYYVDSTFFSIFSFPIIYGDSISILNKKDNAAISHALAKKHFGDINPVGEKITLNNRDLTISGVFEDTPKTSDLHFDALISFVTFDPDNSRVTKQPLDFETYILFKNDNVSNGLIKKINKQSTQLAKNRFNMENANVKVYLQALSDVHLNSNFIILLSGHGEIFDVYFFLFLGVFILILSLINYINLLSTSQISRLKEIGVRKMLGAEKWQIQIQFILESLIYILIALAFSIVIVELVSTPFGKLVGKDFPLKYLKSFVISAGILVAVLGVSIVSGFFPTFLTLHYKIADIFKVIPLRKGHKLIKSISLLAQFSIMVFFVAILVIMNMQSAFINKKDLRFTKERVIYIDDLSEKIKVNFSSIRDKLISKPGISELSLSDYVPGNSGAITNLIKASKPTSSINMIHEMPIDEYFLNTYDIKLKQGRNFHPDSLNDKYAILLNQKAIDLLNQPNLLNDSFFVWKNNCKLIGVVENFHYQSLHDSVSPLILSKYRTIGRKMSVKIANNADIELVTDVLAKTLLGFDKDFYFNYTMINDDIDQLYALDYKNKDLMFYMSIIAIVIFMIGLYSFISFIIIHRTKEIGIRKVLGEEPYSIIFMLMKETGYWIFMANLIALPLTYFASRFWLSKFAYHIENYIVVIIITAVIVFLFTFLTIFFQTKKIAYKNPVNSLRYE